MLKFFDNYLYFVLIYGYILNKNLNLNHML